MYWVLHKVTKRWGGVDSSRMSAAHGRTASAFALAHRLHASRRAVRLHPSKARPRRRSTRASRARWRSLRRRAFARAPACSGKRGSKIDFRVHESSKVGAPREPG